jgi:hypothetical protein
MSNPYRDKLLGIGIIGHRSRPRVREGREHPETGRPWKSVTDEAGTVTEHNVRGDRQDVVARPATVRMVIDRSSGKAANADG